MAISGLGIGFRCLVHRLVSHNGTRTVGGRERRGKVKERRFVGKAEETTRVRTADNDGQ